MKSISQTIILYGPLYSIDTQCLCPSKPANGSMLSNCSGYQSFGSYLYFSCDPGFHQSSGDTTRRCSPGGTWSGSDLVCEKGQFSTLLYTDVIPY